MGTIKKITIIGAGCLGKALVRQLHIKGFQIHEIVSRKKEEVEALCQLTGATANFGDYDSVLPDADLYIVSVKDDAVFEIRKKLKIKDKLVVHTSGTLPFDALKKCVSQFGIFYPLQTFSKRQNTHDFEEYLFCLAFFTASLLDLYDVACCTEQKGLLRQRG
jgi:predicted short-subunit dehydrogenase-like oxidoreductase (DUF2520 family)